MKSIKNTVSASVILTAAILGAFVLCAGCMGDAPLEKNDYLAEKIGVLYNGSAEEAAAAMQDLARYGNASVPYLIEVFKSGDKEASYNAAIAIYYICSISPYPETDVKPILKAFGSSDKNVRDWAINTACLFGAPIVPQLIELAELGNNEVRESAEIAIIKIGEDALPSLQFEQTFGNQRYSSQIQTIIASIYASKGVQKRIAENGTASLTA